MRIGLLLVFTAVFLQIAVFLQPLLPKQYQIAPVCETITRALFQPQFHSSQTLDSHPVAPDHHLKHLDHEHSSVSSAKHSVETEITNKLSPMFHQHANDQTGHGHHDANHQCQYCTVFGHLVLPPEMSVNEVLLRIQVRLVAFQKVFQHVYFALQRLFLIPQGRAPPLFT